jgi:hypothetical protein
VGVAPTAAGQRLDFDVAIVVELVADADDEAAVVEGQAVGEAGMDDLIEPVLDALGDDLVVTGDVGRIVGEGELGALGDAPAAEAAGGRLLENVEPGAFDLVLFDRRPCRPL